MKSHGVALANQTTTTTFRRASDPTSGTRSECWSAETADGVWRFQRLETTGTPWAIIHIATGVEVSWAGSLAKCCRSVALGYAEQELTLELARG